MHITNEIYRPVIITRNGEPRAVLQDPGSYERNIIGILKVLSQSESDIKNGNFKSQEDVFKEIEGSLGGKFKEIMEISEISFSEWNNKEDEVYDTL